MGLLATRRILDPASLSEDTLLTTDSKDPISILKKHRLRHIDYMHQNSLQLMLLEFEMAEDF